MGCDSIFLLVCKTKFFSIFFLTDLVALYKNTVSSVTLDCTITIFYMKKDRAFLCN